MPDYIAVIAFIGGCSIFLASLLYAREFFLLKKQTSSLARRMAQRHAANTIEMEAGTYLRLGDRLAQEGRLEEARTMYSLAIERDPSLIVSAADDSWNKPVHARPERFEAFVQRLAV